MPIEEVLKEIGLSDREIKVYLAGLKTGPVLATKLAQKTGINRTNLYSILKSLQEKGLVSQGEKSYSKYFIMEAPAKLKDGLERKIDRAETIKRELDGILPALKLLTPAPEVTPEVRIFEGKEGITSMLGEIYRTSAKEIQVIQGGKDTVEIVGEDTLDKLIQKRIKRGVKNRAIKKREMVKTKEEDKAELRETRILPQGFNFKTSLVIYGDSVAIISSKEEDFGFTIYSKELVHFFKAFFEMLWKASKRPY